jgi:DNA-binding MarR family transcriptional regulator
MSAGIEEAEAVEAADEIEVSDPWALLGAVASLRGLMQAGDRFRRTLAGTLNVGVTEILALGHLDGHATPRTAGDLAAALGLTRSGVTAVVDRLEAAGLAKRSAQPHDRRQVVITLTDKGTTTVHANMGMIAQALAALGPDRMAAIQQAFTDLAAEIDRQTASIVAESPSKAGD